MHHSENPNPDFWKDKAERLSLGSTGLFPGGKLSADDQGELRLAVTHHEGKVVINFGKPIAWIGFDKKQAEELASLLQSHASRL